MTARRPWRVFVRDIGPSFFYATEERARAKAEALIAPPECYGEVLVYEVRFDLAEIYGEGRRTIYRYGQEPRTQVMTAGKGWEDEPGAA